MLFGPPAYADSLGFKVTKINLEGWASLGGKEEKNQQLSERRAKAVYDDLSKAMNDENLQIDYAGKGEDWNRLVLLTKACPVTGSLNEIIPVARLLEGTDTVLVTEASHFVAHGSLDIRNLRCDAVVADAAELFGARGAALWARRLGSAVSANGAVSPHVLAGLARAVSYAERLGEAPQAPVAPPSERFGRREPMRKGMQGIRQEERILSRWMLRGLARIEGISVFGEDDPRRAAHRIPTFSFTCEGESASALGAALEAEGVQVASGDLGCSATLEHLGHDPENGVLRASLGHYHTRDDVERFLRALRSLI